MNRRGVLRMIAGSAAAGLTGGRQLLAQEKAARAVRGMPSPRIKDVSVIATQPAGARLSVVKVVTDQDGLFGYGCATFTQRADLVNLAVERYLKPLLIGKPADRIEDTWQMCYDSSYWRNGPVLNNAISGVDEALWDIKGRQAGMPVYDLWGGKCREAAQMFANAGGAEPKDVVENVRQAMARGYKHVRVSAGGRGGGGRGGAAAEPAGGGGAGRAASARGLHEGPVFDRGPALRRMLDVFAACRKDLGFEVELMHDMHERYEPRQAIQFVKDCEQFKLYFLEDPLSPEDNDWFRQMRAAMRHSHRDGRAVQQPARVDAANHRTPDRLHPLPRLAGRRGQRGAQNRAARRALRRPRPPGTAPATFPRSATPPSFISISPATISASRRAV